jgi:putative resolvase
MILRRQMRRLVLTHKDRLLRFGAELVFALCELQQIEIVIINKGEQPSFEQELVSDVLEIITVFSARLYGARSNKAKKLIEDVRGLPGLAAEAPA